MRTVRSNTVSAAPAPAGAGVVKGLHAPARELTAAFASPFPATSCRAAELSGLRRKLEAYVSPEQEMLRAPWDVGECLGTWLRPSFDSVLYPYAPPHIRRPKESRKLFVVQLPEAGYFGVRN